MSIFYHKNGNNQLTQSDLQKLAASWISPELAELAGLFRVESQEGAELVGRQPGNSDYAGIVFPYVWPGQSRIRDYRLRRDNPEIEYKNGAAKEKAKYLSAPGRRNSLYFVPGTKAQSLKETSITIVITEGEKKTLSLFRLAT